jgi:hypothetical protein
LPQGTTLEFDYLRELEKNLVYESGIHMGSIHKKIKGQKSRATAPLGMFLVSIETDDSKIIFG